MIPRLAIIVGHTSTAPGLRMVPPLAAPEYFWNFLIAEELQRVAAVMNSYNPPACELKIFTRDLVGLTRTYKAVNAWKATLALELHCNGFDGSARGSETLYGWRNARSEEFARHMQAAIVQLFERKGKQDRGIKRPTLEERGYWNVNLADCPSVLVEPFFGDNIEDATRAKLKQPDYPVTLLKALLTFAESLDDQGPPPQPSG